MSFRLFVYYCAILGGLAALGGWVLGRMLPMAFASMQPATDKLLETAAKALCLGLLVALALALVDNAGAWSLAAWRPAVCGLSRQPRAARRPVSLEACSGRRSSTWPLVRCCGCRGGP